MGWQTFISDRSFYCILPPKLVDGVRPPQAKKMNKHKFKKRLKRDRHKRV